MEPVPEQTQRSQVTQRSPTQDDVARAVLRNQLISNEAPFSFKTVGGVRFVVQIILSFSFAIFCGFNLIWSRPSDAWKTVYWAGITNIVTLWLPSPRGRD